FANWVRPPGGFGFPVNVPLSDERTHFSANAMDLFHPMILDRSPVGMVYIHCNLDEQRQRLERYMLIALGVLLLSVLLALAVSRPLGRRISKPILDLVAVARRVSQERNYAIRVQATGGGEVRLLIDAFNQ